MSTRRTAALRTGAGVVLLTSLQTLAIAVTFIVLANRLGPAEYGSIAFAMAAGSFAPIIAGLGGEFVLVMFGSRDSRAVPELFGNALATRVVLSLLLLAASHAVALAIGYPDLATFNLIAAGLLVAGLADPLLVSQFRVERRLLDYYTLASLGRLLFLVFVVAAIHGPGDVRLAAGGYLVSHALTAATALVIAVLRTRPRLSVRRARAHRREAVLFTGSQLVDVAATRMDVLILFAVTTVAAVGVYNAGYRVASALLTLPAAVHSVMLPEFHQAAAESTERLRRVFSETLASLTELAIVACGVFVAAHAHLTSVLLSDEYAGAGVVLALIATALGATYLGYAYAMLAEASGRIGRRLIVRIAAACAGFVLIALLAARFGAPGAAAGTLASSLIFVVLLARVTAGAIPQRQGLPLIRVALGVAAAGTTALIARAVPLTLAGLVLVVLIYLGVLALIAAAVHLIRPGEIRSIEYARHLWGELRARREPAAEDLRASAPQ